MGLCWRGERRPRHACLELGSLEGDAARRLSRRRLQIWWFLSPLQICHRTNLSRN